MNYSEELEKDFIYVRDNLEKLETLYEIQDTSIDNMNPIKRFVKRVVRKMTYWLIRPYWTQQIEFNIALKNIVSDMYRIQTKLTYGDDFGNYGMLNMYNDNMNEYLLELQAEKGTRIFQIVSSLNYGDAVGNDVMTIQKFLREKGYKTGIFTNHVHRKIPRGTAFSIGKMPKLRKNDIILYHFASEDPLTQVIKEAPCKVILRYHNVTPPRFFKGFDINAEHNTKKGLRQIKELAPYIDYGIVVSEFNKSNLREMGYTCPIDVAPILIQFDDYKKEPNQDVIDEYNDGKTNIVFVGRMAPNKKVEDVISSFAEYKKTYDKDARLFLVGNFNENDKYYQFLLKHIKKLGVQDVIFPGHIPFDEILAYYSIADIFLCMSEHEGFCVPLVEAMFFNVPIIAYDSCAVPNTLDGTGVLIKDKNWDEIAAQMNKIISDDAYRSDLLDGEKKRLQEFDNEIIGNQIVGYINNFR
ncbi:MAG: glycosyltransferase family 4 protein [Lachnobacterium sp.]|nr:glycosyltransferase family 4 protein [Lachnobacterium sp.]